MTNTLTDTIAEFTTNGGGAGAGVYLPLGTSAIADGTNGTFFTQFAINDITQGPGVAVNIVISDAAVITASTGFGAGNGSMVQFNYDSSDTTGGAPNHFRIRNGGGFVVASLSPGGTAYNPLPGVTYDLWIEIKNGTGTTADTYQVFMDGGDIPTRTLLYGAGGSTSTFTLRNGGTSKALQTLYLAHGGNTTNVAGANIDNIYVTPGLNFTNPVTGLPPSVLFPTISAQPAEERVYEGHSAIFMAAASGGGLTYRWQKDNAFIGDDTHRTGSSTNMLLINNLSAADIGNYQIVVSNSVGSITSSIAPLSLVTPSTLYETNVLSANPLYYYRLDETGDPSTNAQAFDYIGGSNAVYGTSAQNGFSGIAGPGPTDGFPGLSSGNFAANFFNLTANSHITEALPWSLNTNTVTLSGWIKPTGVHNPFEGIIFSRGGTTVAGLNYSTTGTTLGYTWNNEGGTTSWDSGLQPPSDQWSFVALVVTPTNATIHLMNTNGLVSSTHIYPHIVQRFDGTNLIGDDGSIASGLRIMNGAIDDVAVFNTALSRSQLENIFFAATGVTNYAPAIVSGPSPQSLSVYPGQTAQFTVAGGGSDPVYYQWQLEGTNISNSGNITGTATDTITITNANNGNAGNYSLILTNSSGAVTSGVATLTILTPGAPITITLSSVQPSGSDWNSPNYWSDNNPASVSAISNPGSTYEVFAGARLRSPATVNSPFPGDTLTIDGDGVFADGSTNTPNTGELRFKHSADTSIFFKKLILNGGELDNGDNGAVTITGGELNVESQSTIYTDSSSSAGSLRNYQVASWLTGAGTLQYSSYDSAFLNDLNLTGTSNSFSGQWNIMRGAVVGSGINSLGTNTVKILTDGALETAYDINNPNADLIINGSGKVFLHQNDTFHKVIINGIELAQGTHPASALGASLPANFPATWPLQIGSTINTASGSITVLEGTVAPVTLGLSQTNSTLTLTWSPNAQGLQEATNLTGPWTTVSNGLTSPFVVTNFSDPEHFYRVKVQ